MLWPYSLDLKKKLRQFDTPGDKDDLSLLKLLVLMRQWKGDKERLYAIKCHIAMN